MSLLHKLKRGELRLDCLKTGRKSEFVIVKKNESRDTFICSRCALDICHSKEYSKEDLLPIEDFFDRIEAGILQVRANSIDNKLIDEAFHAFEDTLTDRYAVCLQQTVGRFQDQVIAAVDECHEGQSQPVSYQVPKAAEAEDALTMLIRFYRQVHAQSDHILLSHFEKLETFSPDLQSHSTVLNNTVRAEVNRIIQPVKHALQMAPELSEATTDTVKRYVSLNDNYTHFSANMNYSVNFKVSQPVWFYGISQVAVEQEGEGVEADYFISIGKAKSSHNGLLHHKQQVQTKMDKLLRATSQQFQGSFAVLFKAPIELSPETWYNLSMSLPKESSAVFRSYRGLCQSNQFQVLVCAAESGVEMCFNRAVDDNTNMSLFNGFVCDFFISKPASSSTESSSQQLT